MLQKSQTLFFLNLRYIFLLAHMCIFVYGNFKQKWWLKLIFSHQYLMKMFPKDCVVNWVQTHWLDQTTRIFIIHKDRMRFQSLGCKKSNKWYLKQNDMCKVLFKSLYIVLYILEYWFVVALSGNFNLNTNKF